MSKTNLFYYLEGLGTLQNYAMFRVLLEGETLTLNHVKPRLVGNDKVIQSYKINAENILDLGIVKTTELQKKSVVGRGAVGGLLFGPVGAMLGGMSAADKGKVKSVLAISYLPSAGGEPKTIMLDADPPSWGGLNMSYIAKLKKELAKTPKSQAVMGYLGQTINKDGSITL